MVDGTSFAFDGVGGVWQWYEDDGRKLPIAEIRESERLVAADDGDLARRDFIAMVHRKLKLAEAGRLRVPGDGRESLVLVRGLMEIKWRIGRHQWRLYYCEPPMLRPSRTMLGLHFHRKVDVDQQNAGIREAARRWMSWQTRPRG